MINLCKWDVETQLYCMSTKQIILQNKTWHFATGICLYYLLNRHVSIHSGCLWRFKGNFMWSNHVARLPSTSLLQIHSSSIFSLHGSRSVFSWEVSSSAFCFFFVFCFLQNILWTLHRLICVFKIQMNPQWLLVSVSNLYPRKAVWCRLCISVEKFATGVSAKFSAIFWKGKSHCVAVQATTHCACLNVSRKRLLLVKSVPGENPDTSCLISTAINLNLLHDSLLKNASTDPTYERGLSVCVTDFAHHRWLFLFEGISYRHPQHLTRSAPPLKSISPRLSTVDPTASFRSPASRPPSCPSCGNRSHPRKLIGFRCCTHEPPPSAILHTAYLKRW